MTLDKKLTLKNKSFKTVFYTVALCVAVVSCGSTKSAVSHNKKLQPVKREIPTKTVAKEVGLRELGSHYVGRNSNEIDKLLKDAQKYLGAPYKYGGLSSAGFDCSGFTLTVFEQNDYKLPRRSSDQALTGDEIDITKVKPGDLLFFSTAGGGRVSHVGIVHDIGTGGEVKFIHASTSKGVIISSLNEKYWNKAYLHANRIL